MNRRAFLMNTGILMVGVMAARNAKAASICGGDLNQPLEGQIGANHGHRLLVPRSDVMAGKDKSYDIQGSSGHGHIVIVTEELFAELKANGQAQMESSNDFGHSHPITLICAP